MPFYSGLGLGLGLAQLSMEEAQMKHAVAKDDWTGYTGFDDGQC